MEEEQVNIGGGEGGAGDHLVRKKDMAPNVSQEEIDVIQESMDVIRVIESFGDFRRTQKKECFNLVRRIKFLVPLLEEISELDKPLSDSLNACLHNLKKALFCTKKLLKICRDKSKIYLAYESESIMSKFHDLYDKLSMVLDAIPLDEIGISDEVKEQVELMSVQFKRAKRRTETQDIEFAMDMMVVFSEKDDRNADSAILERLAKKLELHAIQELREETIAVRKLVKERNGQNTESTQKIIDLLNKFKKIAGLEVFDVLNDLDAPKILVRSPSVAIPHDFLCPITLEIMRDPVIIASGQTYERESIEKWFEANHRTCPKTRQTLAHFSLAPNFALKNLILQWCEKYKIELPKKEATSTADAEGSSLEQNEEVASLIGNLSSSHLDVQRAAVTKIRMLSKENPENRVMLAENGGIPLLVQLLSYPDSKIQEHTVTALLNLSIDDTNKRLISEEPEAIPAIIEVLQKGTIEAKENSAACLFSLSMLDENKVAIGALGGIPPLVDLLQNGTIRGKKDAITALFNLSLNQENTAKAIQAGIMKPLLKLLTRKNLDMVNEALSIFLILASHPEGRSEMGQLSFIEKLVEFIKDGTPKNKECAVSVLLQLGMHNSSSMLAALQYGVFEHLVEVSKSGTNRAQRKATLLLSYMSKHEQIP